MHDLITGKGSRVLRRVLMSLYKLGKSPLYFLLMKQSIITKTTIMTLYSGVKLHFIICFKLFSNYTQGLN